MASAAELKPYLVGAEVVGYRRVLPFAFDPTLIEGEDQLCFIHRSGSGADWFDIDLLSRKGILVAVNKGFNAPSVVEHALVLTLLCLRRTIDFVDSMRAGAWARDLPDPQPLMLSGKTVGIVGAGAVGSRVAEVMAVLNAEVLVYQRDRTVSLPTGAVWTDLDTLLGSSDVVSLHVPLLAETRHMLSDREFAAMKDGVVIVNTARGPVIDEAALVNALRSGKVRAAGLDVFEGEPLAPDHPFRAMPNVVLTPHVGGAGDEIVARQVEGTISNIELFVAGKRPLRLVNPEILLDGRARAAHLVG